MPIDTSIQRPDLAHSILLGMILRLSLICLLSVQATHVHSQDYPPTGERLRTLASAVDFQIGYASRYDFRNQTYGELYERLVKAEFNIVTPENSLKWVFVHPFRGVYDFTDMDELAQFAGENDMALHGHPLLWYFQNPPWLDSLTAAELETVMLQHIAAVVGRYKGKVQVWDVVNEVLANTEQGGGLLSNIWLDAMGESYISKAFAAARAADPQASLIFNETGVGWLTPKSDEMFELVQKLLDEGVPIDGVGFQMHISHRFEEYEQLSDDMQRYADLGLDIYLTEFDVTTLESTDPELQADVYEGVIRRCLSQPRCRAVQIWGIDDFNSWRPQFNPLPFDDNFNVKPAYYGMQRALSARFLQPEEHISDAQGSTVSGAVRPSAMARSLRIKSVDLSSGFRSATLRYASLSDDPIVVELRSATSDGGELNGDLLGTFSLQRTGNLSAFDTVSIEIAPTANLDAEQAVIQAVRQDDRQQYAAAPGTGADQGGSGTPQDIVMVFAGNADSVAIDWLSLEDPAASTSLPAGKSGGGLLSWWFLAALFCFSVFVRYYRRCLATAAIRQRIAEH